MGINIYLKNNKMGIVIGVIVLVGLALLYNFSMDSYGDKKDRGGDY